MILDNLTLISLLVAGGVSAFILSSLRRRKDRNGRCPAERQSDSR
jgi:hypothetical protein